MPQITGTCPKCHQYSSWTEDEPCYKCVEQERRQKKWEDFIESHKEQIEKFWYAMFDAIFPPDKFGKLNKSYYENIKKTIKELFY